MLLTDSSDDYGNDDDDEEVNQKLYTEAVRQYKGKFMKLIYNQLVQEKLSLLSVVLKQADTKSFATALLVSS